MDTLGFLIGLIGLALTLWDKNAALRWLGIALLIVGCAAFLKRFIGRTQIQFFIFRRALLIRQFEIVSEHASAEERRYLLDYVASLAKSGKLALYGELGGSHMLVKIPLVHFNKHSILYLPETLYTYDPTKDISSQVDEQYFQIYAPMSLMPKLTSALQKRRKQSGVGN